MISVLLQTVSLAAQLRAFSSLLSLPSQAQSVIKAFRRQGIGSADEFNTARFLSSPDLKAFPLHLRHYRSFGSAPSLPNLPRAGRVGRFASNGETVSSTSFQPQTRQTLASALWPLWFLVTVVPVAERPLSPVSTFVRPPPAADYVLASYGICGQFPHLLMQTRKPSPNTIGPPTFARLCVTASLTAISRPKGCILIISIAKECILRLSPPDAFIV